MKLTRHASRRLAAATITCTAILVPTAALAAAGSAATAGAPASGTRPARPVTAYVVNTGSDTVIPIDTATGKAIKVGSAPDAIAAQFGPGRGTEPVGCASQVCWLCESRTMRSAAANSGSCSVAVVWRMSRSMDQ